MEKPCKGVIHVEAQPRSHHQPQSQSAKALVYKLHITVCSNWRQRNEAFISHWLRATAEGCRLPGPSSCM